MSKFEYLKGDTFGEKIFYDQYELTYYLVARSKALKLNPTGLRLVATWQE